MAIFVLCIDNTLAADVLVVGEIFEVMHINERDGYYALSGLGWFTMARFSGRRWPRYNSTTLHKRGDLLHREISTPPMSAQGSLAEGICSADRVRSNPGGGRYDNTTT